LSALAEQGDLAFREPLTITRDRTILDGYARVELARHKGRSALPCIEYDLNQEDALCWLLRTHRRSEGLNSFCRILLALDLEHGLQEKARSNQRLGGLNKGSSNLTEADRLDVRSQIASAAGVSIGNVTKVKHLKTAACQELQDALRCAEISIHRAWIWSKLSLEEQRKTLWRSRTEEKMGKTIWALIAAQRSKSAATTLDPIAFAEHLGTLESHELAAVRVEQLRICGKTIIVSEELAQTLGLEQLCLCDTKTP